MTSYVKKANGSGNMQSQSLKIFLVNQSNQDQTIL
jgi:hypothetical protein